VARPWDTNWRRVPTMRPLEQLATAQMLRNKRGTGLLSALMRYTLLKFDQYEPVRPFVTFRYGGSLENREAW
jgi:hypothetical protein